MDSPVSILSGGKFNENWRVQTAYRSSNIRRPRPACKPSACDGCRAENGSCSPTEAAPARASTPNTCSCYPVLPATVETLVKHRDDSHSSTYNLSTSQIFLPLFSPTPIRIIYLIPSLATYTRLSLPSLQLSSSSFGTSQTYSRTRYPFSYLTV